MEVNVLVPINIAPHRSCWTRGGTIAGPSLFQPTPAPSSLPSSPPHHSPSLPHTPPQPYAPLEADCSHFLSVSTYQCQKTGACCHGNSHSKGRGEGGLPHCWTCVCMFRCVCLCVCGGVRVCVWMRQSWPWCPCGWIWISSVYVSLARLCVGARELTYDSHFTYIAHPVFQCTRSNKFRVLKKV